MPPGTGGRDDAKRPIGLRDDKTKRRNHMSIRLSLDPRPMARIGAICSMATGLTIFLAAFVIGGSGGPVDPNLSAVEIVKGAAGQHDSIQLSSVVDDLGSAMFLVFVLILGRLAEPEGGLLSRAAAYMAASWLAINLVWAGAQFAFADATVHNTDPNAAKGLFLLSQSLLVVIAVPIALQYAALGLLVLRTRVLPAFMGWFALLATATAMVSVVASIYSVLDPVGFAAFIVSAMLWPLVAGIVLLVRRPSGVVSVVSEPQVDATRPAR